MFAGTCLKGINAIYFKQRLDFLFEFLPMVAFASSLFVYMVVLIFMKWSINWNSRMLSATCLEPRGEGWGSARVSRVSGHLPVRRRWKRPLHPLGIRLLR